VGCNEKKNSIVACDSITISNKKVLTFVELEKGNRDTIFPLQINNKVYQLVLTHEFLFDKAGLKTAVRIIDKRNDTLFNKIFDFNTVGELSEPAPNNYWLTLYNTGYGSGYSGTLFKIRIIPQICLQPILKYNELSFWKSNRSATELILFEGIWAANNAKKLESHFAEHKQFISIYKIKEDTILIKEIGKTKNKFDFFENKNALYELQKKEPVLRKAINWSDYN
jgi:hypothetical protein